MAKERFLKGLELVRRDVGSLLFHWTRQKTAYDAFPEKKPNCLPTAYSVLAMVLNKKKLVGGTGFIKGGSKCICFTEMPISEVSALFRLSQAMKPEDRPRYEPYGIAVKKEWLYRRGGRPVIYQSDAEYNILPDSIKWRHVQYDPTTGIDFTWERERRIRIDELLLEPKDTLVVVPSVKDARSLRKKLGNEHDEDHDAWMIVSLDFFGVATEQI